MTTKTQEAYAAQVPDMAVRLEAARLWETLVKASEARAEVDSSGVPEELVSQLDDAEAVYSEACRQALIARNEAIDRLMGPINRAVVEAEDAAQDAYDQHEGGAVLTDDDDEVIRCALSGAPLYEDDVVLETPYGNFKILASVVLPEDVLSQISDEDAD